jgi:hypothetical protein
MCPLPQVGTISMKAGLTVRAASTLSYRRMHDSGVSVACTKNWSPNPTPRNGAS